MCWDTLNIDKVLHVRTPHKNEINLRIKVSKTVLTYFTTNRCSEHSVRASHSRAQELRTAQQVWSLYSAAHVAQWTRRVLITTPPEIQDEEVEMTRGERTALEQLRSGFSSDLESFKNRIGISGSPLCHCCRLSEHTTEHIFDCPEHPTHLTPLDMWLNPRRVVEHLRTWPCFDSRLLRERPAPEPPLRN